MLRNLHNFKMKSWSGDNDICTQCNLSRVYCRSFDIEDCPVIHYEDRVAGFTYNFCPQGTQGMPMKDTNTETLNRMQEDLKKLWKIRDSRYETLGRYIVSNSIPVNGSEDLLTLHKDAQTATQEVGKQEDLIAAFRKYI